ncbi:hypothetical protein G7Z17_g2545 [Cylindrodendrum hubeiense]|uniref:Uncharacterized protein n=1 Tax=Cylindrodendrum hubeiense TaxID=595255 RepID=A0A9P5HCJ6_9HYPO|nr:hypothetical protein G7Z17_g2545 [Cylindrodendrum hubeiense]
MLASTCWAVAGLLLGANTAYGSVIRVPRADDTITPIASTTTSYDATITSAPYYSADSNVVINNCSYYNTTEQRTLWNNPWCSVYAGNVELVYWPTGNNFSYPSTMTDSIDADFTYTSPSVYMIVNTLYGSNVCGLLGPTTSREIFSFTYGELSTLVPYFDTTATYRRATRELYFSDLETNCASTYDYSTLTTQLHPVKDDDTRCNPSIVLPGVVKQYGYPYWLHCGVRNFKYGIFDPPYAIPTVNGLIATTAAAPITTADPATAAATNQATAKQDPTSVAGTKAATATEVSGDSDDDSSDDSNDDPSDSNDDPSDTNDDDSGASETSVADPANTDSSDSNDDDSGDSNNGAGNSDDSSSSQTTAAHPANADPDAAASTAAEQVVSLGTGGVVVVNHGSTSTVPVSRDPTASVVTFSGTTLTLGGAAATITNAAVVADDPSNAVSTVAQQVVSLGTDGVVIVNDGKTTTSKVSGSDGSVASVVTFDGTTLTVGGSAATLTNVVVANNAGSTGSVVVDSDAVVATVAQEVVSLGADGVVVVDSDGSTTRTYTVAGSGATASGSSDSVTSVIVYHGTTLTLGGSAATLTNAVVTVPGADNSGSADSGYSTPESTPVQVGTSAASRAASGLVGLLLSVMASVWLL